MYTTGTYPASTTPGVTFLRTVLPDLLLSAGLTLVAEVEHSTGNWAAIYRFPDGRYVMFGTTSTNQAGVYATIFETYDSGNATTPFSGVGNSQTGSTSTYPLTADGRRAVSTSNTALLAVNYISAFNAGFSVSLSTLGGQYWFSGNSERIVLGTRSSTSDAGVYVGSIASVPPAIVGGFNHYLVRLWSSYGTTTTREPGITSAGAVKAALILNLAPDGSISATPDTYSGKYPVARARVQSGRDGQGRHGVLRDVFVSQLGTPVNGDTSVIDGRLHVCMREGATWSFFVDTTV